MGSAHIKAASKMLMKLTPVDHGTTLKSGNWLKMCGNIYGRTRNKVLMSLQSSGWLLQQL